MAEQDLPQPAGRGCIHGVVGYCTKCNDTRILARWQIRARDAEAKLAALTAAQPKAGPLLTKFLNEAEKAGITHLNVKADERGSAEPVGMVVKRLNLTTGQSFIGPELFVAHADLPIGTLLYTEAHPDSAQPNPWRQAIDEALIVSCLDCIGPDESPKAALARLVEWEKEMVLDPQISERAAALVDSAQARDAAQAAELTGVELGTVIHNVPTFGDEKANVTYRVRLARAIERAVLAKNGLGGKQ